MADPELGFIGLGQMGARMSARLVEACHTVWVFDTNPAAVEALVALGAKAASSVVDVASRADIVLLSLPTPDVVRAVSLGAEGVAAGTRARILVDLSTTGPRAAAAIAAELDKEGRLQLVDAPVSGGITGAAKGTLAVMVSGPRDAVGAVEPFLAVLGKVFECGEKPGMAQTLKLANNMISVAALTISAEAMAMGVKAGLDPAKMIEVIMASSGGNVALRDKFPRAVLPGTFDFGFATALSYKDVRLCVDEAEAMGVPMVVGSAVRQMMAVTNATFGPDSDFTSVARVVEGWADVEIRGQT